MAHGEIVRPIVTDVSIDRSRTVGAKRDVGISRRRRSCGRVAQPRGGWRVAELIVFRKHQRGVLIIAGLGRVEGDVGWQPDDRAIEIDPPPHVVLERRARRAGNTGGDAARPCHFRRVILRHGVDAVIKCEHIGAVGRVHGKTLYRTGADRARRPREKCAAAAKKQHSKRGESEGSNALYPERGMGGEHPSFTEQDGCLAAGKKRFLTPCRFAA